jgi:hypothetical protein
MYPPTISRSPSRNSSQTPTVSLTSSHAARTAAMDTDRVDALLRDWTALRSRRLALRLASALGIAQLVGDSDTRAKSKRKKRKKPKPSGSRPSPPPVVVTCPLACPDCTTCNASTGRCEVRPDGNGLPGQNCPAPRTCCNGVCLPELRCCAGGHCSSGRSCLANGSCARACTPPVGGECALSCNCQVGPDGAAVCFQPLADPCPNQSCRTTGNWDPGLGCVAWSCGGVDVGRCVALCTA